MCDARRLLSDIVDVLVRGGSTLRAIMTVMKRGRSSWNNYSCSRLVSEVGAVKSVEDRRPEPSSVWGRRSARVKGTHDAETATSTSCPFPKVFTPQHSFTLPKVLLRLANFPTAGNLNNPLKFNLLPRRHPRPESPLW